MFNTEQVKRRRDMMKRQLHTLEKSLFDLDDSLGKPLEPMLKAVKEKKDQDIKGHQPKGTEEKKSIPGNVGKDRASVDKLFQDKQIKDIDVPGLEKMMNSLDTMVSNGNRYAQVALDRVYAEYLTRKTGAGAAQPQKAMDPKKKLELMDTKIKGAHKTIGSIKDTKKRNKAKKALNKFIGERNKLNKEINGGGK